MKKSIFAFLFLIILAMACKKEESNVNGPSTAFPFIKSGVVFTYINSDNDPNHAGITFETSYTINSINSGGWCSVSWMIPGMTQPLTWFVSNYEFSDMGLEARNARFPIITNPAVLNDQYSMSWVQAGVNTINTRKVINLNAATDVPAGSFTNCIIIHETTNIDTIYYKNYWINLQKGIVRMEGTTKEDYPTIIIQQLKN